MRSRARWQSAQPGVMVYMPAPRVSVDETRDSLSRLSVTGDFDSSSALHSQQSQVSDTILPSLEIGSDVQVKEEPGSFESTRFASPETLVDTDRGEIFEDAVPVVYSPGSFLSQLIAAAGSDLLESSTPDPVSSSSRISEVSTEDYVHVGYESDRTDFQEVTPCPSVRKIAHKRATVTRRTSQHFQRQKSQRKYQGVVRSLDFGARNKKRPTKSTSRSANMQALEDLRVLERAPSHSWDQDERELLCILNRWYCAPDRTTELEMFAKLFNSITGLGLRPHIIRNQYECHLLLYGGLCFREYGRVYGVPFDDPEGRYTEIRNVLEEEIKSSGLDLRRRKTEEFVASGKAKYAKSPVTRRIYKSLVKKARQEEKVGAHQTSGRGHASTDSQSFATIGRAIRAPTDEEWEIISHASTSPEPITEYVQEITTPTPVSVTARPHLAFRVWDAANRTKFINGRFVAQCFVNWPSPLPAPIALDDSSEAGKILTLLHLSKQGATPVYISTASSLLQALSYATSMQHPRIALIDLDAASLQEDHKLHHAADIFRWLKSHGLAQWARYKGYGEYFAWSDIAHDAVLQTFELDQLIDNLNADEGCRELFNFDVFEPGAKTSTIAASLRERNLTLNTTTARALGRIAKLFGMAKDNMNLHHLEDFIARLLDGWTIERPAAIDMHTMSSLAAVFATTLGTHAGGYTLQDVMGGFIGGVDQGARCIAHWSHSRSGGRRKRFREA
ncbi:hypothetical protein C7974DRAFT_234773 [Boeremia exigua]|uniref:uncharacterized protein n=1 Tax=Boeremia exigua TaxID=749465 RepID=UPI001E8E27AF|nr:uncharacterized protein C7974DRAFT_234773 [Boeremia exigua]KAH6620467.1 hypothetical protein C7974DRAFT_234773 [Boeremia exigua]